MSPWARPSQYKVYGTANLVELNNRLIPVSTAVPTRRRSLGPMPNVRAVEPSMLPNRLISITHAYSVSNKL